MNIKSFFYTIIAIISIFVTTQLYSQTWTPLTSGTTNDLLGVSAPSTCVAYVCGGNGAILKTTNGGASWVAQTSGTTQELYSICFTNIDTGFAVGNGGAALQTTNGGATWTPMSLNTTYNYRQIKFFNSNVGYISGGTPGGTSGVVFKTTDGGATWTSVLTTPNGGVYSTYFTSLNVGYAFEGTSGLIYETTNGGTTWTTVSSGLNYSGQLWFTSPTTGFVSGDLATTSNGGIVATSNSGASWSTTTGSTSTNALTGLGFYNANNGFAVGGNVSANTGLLLQTVNGGTIWTQVALPLGTPRLYRISFYNQTTGYIAGLNGTILKYLPPVAASNISITGVTTVCAGQSTTLTAAGGISYVWSTGASTAAITVTPAAAATYTVIGTGACFTDTVLSTVTVFVQPIITVNSATICDGSSVTLTANGANTYTWLPATGLSSTSGSSVTAMPSVTTTYTVMGSNSSSLGPEQVYNGDFTLGNTGFTNNYTYTPSVFTDGTYFVGNDLYSNDANPTYPGHTGNGLADKFMTIQLSANPDTIWEQTITTLQTNQNYQFSFWSTLGARGPQYTVGHYQVHFITSSLGDQMVSDVVVPQITVLAWQWWQCCNITWNSQGNTSLTIKITNVATVGTSPNQFGIDDISLKPINGNCPATAVSNVVVNSLPSITVNSATICQGQSTILSASGASTYTWTPGTGLNFTSGSNVSANPATTTNYTVTGTDLNGCKNTAVSVVSVLNALPVVTVSSATICQGQSTILSASGASTYTWTPGTGLSSTTGLSVIASPTTSTTYTVTGSNGCFSNTTTSTVTVLTTPIVVTINSSTICNGSSATLTANGANTYVWSPATGLSSTNGSSVTASPTTTTTYTVAGSNNCFSNTATSTVTIYPIPVISVNSATICIGASATLTAIGANTYTWTPVTNLNSVTGAVVVATPTITTSYIVSGTNANGCFNKATSVVTISTPSSGIMVNSATICAGDSVLLTATGGTNSYSWSPSIGLSGITGATVTATPSSTTNYTVVASGGCGNTNAISMVAVNPLPSGTSSSSGKGCQSIQALFTGSNGTPPYRFTFQLNGALQSIKGKAGNTANLSIQNVALGTYTCSLISVQDSNFCSSTIINDSTVINVYQNPIALFTASPIQTDILTPKITITDASAGAVGWLWNFGDSSTSVSPNPLSHSYKDSGVYTIKLVINSSVGCKDSSYQTVTITPFFAICIPNAFTPNGDGINDFFTPKGEGVLNYEMNIYDRWGNMIYSTNDMNKGWDGKANGGSQVAQMDAYVYTITLTAASNKDEYVYRGSFYLLGK